MQAFNPRLHSLRGIAAVAVMLFHWDTLFPALGKVLSQVEFAGTEWNLFMQIRFGGLGVALFFVLSGYLLGSQLQTRELTPGSIARFWKRRAMRIYPAAWAQLLILVAAISVWPDFLGGLDGYRLLHNVLLWINLPPTMVSPINGVWWTLPIELSFYLLLPFLVLLQRKIGIVWVIALCFVVTLCWRSSIMVMHYGDNYLRHLPVLDAIPGTLSSFAAGLAISYLRIPLSARQRIVWLLVTACCFLLMEYWLLSQIDTYWKGHWMLAIWPVLLAVILASGVFLLCEPIKGLGFMSSRLMVWLGEVSFGIYLWHFPLQKLMLFLWPEAWGTPVTSALALLVSSATTLCLAALSFYAIERPIMGWKRAKPLTPMAPTQE